MNGGDSGFRAAVAALFLVAGACAAPPQEIMTPQDAAMESSLRAAAIASQEVNNYTGAVAYFASLYERDPSDLEVVLGYARNLRFVGDVGRAVAVLERALEAHPDDARLVAEYGRALLSADRPEDAIVQLERAAILDPADWRVPSAIGIAHDRLDRPAEAVAAYQAAPALAPGNPTILNNLALSQAMAGEIDAGIATLRIASVRPGAGVQTRQNLALLLALGGGLAEAESLVEADLPRAMARVNMAYLRRIAEARAAGASASEVLENLPVLTGEPEIAPVPSTAAVAVEPVAEPEATTVDEATADTTTADTTTADETMVEVATDDATTEPAAAETEDDFAATAAEAADEAFASLPDATDAEPEPGADRMFGAQLASYGDPTAADDGRAELEVALGDIGRRAGIRVMPIEIANQPTIYRIYLGEFGSVGDSRRLCIDARDAGVDCVVTAAP